MNFPLPAECAEILRDRIVFCGFSGGSDSLYLLLALKEISAPLHFQLQAVHFNHGLRGAESDADEAWCREKCRAESIPFREIRLEVRKTSGGGGVENAARAARLAEWKRLTEMTPASVVVLGHQAEDRRESLFLRLFRGSNVSGLTSLRLCSTVDGVTFVRPLLRREKRELEECLRAAGEVWRTDSSNRIAFCGRNFLRLEVFPRLQERFPHAESGILRSLEVLEQDAEYLEQEARRIFRSGSLRSPAEWALLHPALRCRAFRLLLEEAGIGAPPDAAQLERFSELVASPPENGEVRRMPVSGEEGVFVCAGRDRVSVQRMEEISPPLEWDLEHSPVCRFGRYEFSAEQTEADGGCPPDRMTVFFSLELPRKLQLSCRRDGERMIPFGRHHPVPLKKLYSEGRIGICGRGHFPLLRSGEGEILWIPGLRRSAFYPVPAGERRMWRIRVRLLPEGSGTDGRKKD